MNTEPSRACTAAASGVAGGLGSSSAEWPKGGAVLVPLAVTASSVEVITAPSRRAIMPGRIGAGNTVRSRELLKYSVHGKPAVGAELWKRDVGMSGRASTSSVVTLALVIMSESCM